MSNALKLKLYLVNPFAEYAFGGNAAAVNTLTHWLRDDLMQQIAGQHREAEIIGNTTIQAQRLFGLRATR